MLPILRIDYKPGELAIEVEQTGDGGPDSLNRLGTLHHMEGILRSINDGCPSDNQIMTEKNHCYYIRTRGGHVMGIGKAFALIHAQGVEYQFKQDGFYPYCHIISEYWQRTILDWEGQLFLHKKILRGECLIEIVTDPSASSFGLGFINARD